jgi:Zn-finger nucleic acid-binding protein
VNAREGAKAMPLLMCPHCEEGMQEIKRHEVEIDVCPKCRGVWLDRGELEKLLGAAKEDREEMDEMRQYIPADKHPHHKKKKKKSMFDMLDIFD